MVDITLGSRASKLALLQTQIVLPILQAIYPQWRFRSQSFSTSGDRILHKPLAEIGGKALFVKELEAELLQGNIDAAVHSLKDVPGDMDTDLFSLLPLGSRADPRDALLLAPGHDAISAIDQPRIGTSSARRSAQLQILYPQVECLSVRGNVQTRLAKLHSGAYHGIVLAAAGLERLQLQQHIQQLFSIDQMVPAIGQGALALQVRRDDPRWQRLQAALDPELNLCLSCERALAQALGADCFSSIGAYARMQSNILHLDIFYQANPQAPAHKSSHQLELSNSAHATNQATEWVQQISQSLTN